MDIKDFDNADTLSIDTLALEDFIQEERSREISDLHKLSKKVCFLHTSLLYYRNSKSKVGSLCLETWRSLVKTTGGSPNCWRDLGFHLGVGQDDLDYIKHSMKDDPTDVVLKIFMQDEKATIDKILDAFIKMKRYDVLKLVEKPLNELSNYFKKEESKSDLGYHSNSNNNSEEREIISFKNNLLNDLPPVLNKNSTAESYPNKPPQPTKITNLEDLDKENINVKTLFLTYAEDGYEIAMDIAERVNNWPEEFNVQVLMLDDRRETVLKSPENIIREYYDKASFIVPIVTSDYIQMIESKTECASHNLDCKYASYIHQLIVNNYLHVSRCINLNVRSVIPSKCNYKIIKKLAMYPYLQPWTGHNMFDEHFQEYLSDNLDED